MSHPPPARSRSGDHSNRPRSTGNIYFGLVSAFRASVLILAASIFLLASCTSPTPPSPPPPTGPDTTSHEFIWQIDTLGDGNSSVLYDVAIINDTTIWAVGEIYLKDSTGQVDPDAYNLVKWNGRMWSYERVLYPFGGAWFNAPLHSVFALMHDDVWVGSNQPMHWNGMSWRTFDLGSDTWNGWINKIWASADAGTYLVGTAGAIAHFDGTTWRRIESGTTVDLVDVWGTDPSNVWIAGYDLITGQSGVLLRIRYGQVERRYEYLPPYPGNRQDSLTGIVTAVWTDAEERVLVLDGGNVWTLPEDTHGNGSLLWSRSEEGGFLTGLRGSSINNVFVTGHYGEVGHFNGSSWMWYKQFFSFSGNLHFRGLACTRSQVAAVGSTVGKGILLRGRRL